MPAGFDVMGLGLATNAVTVNGQAAYHKGEYFRAEVPVSNGSTSVWQSVSVVATNQTTVSGNAYVPKNQEQFYYDLDGNLTNDGRWTYTWDAENRLVKLTPNTLIGPRNSIKFEYDWQGRRIHKQVWGNTNWTSTPTNDVKFVYDGWNLLAELNATNNAVIRSFMWGLDLSGSLQGAGGVGGLLEVVYKAAQATNCFVAFDGNGNVAAMADAGSTNILAQYEYGPFGELIRATGPMASSNPFRFSTKFQDCETELLYYGYRYYSPFSGRWINPDPIGVEGGVNHYAFICNDPLDRSDWIGLMEIKHVGPGFQFVPPPQNYFWLGIYARFDAQDYAKVGGSAYVVSRAQLSWRIRPCGGNWFSGTGKAYFLDSFYMGSNGDVAGFGAGTPMMEDGKQAVYFNPINAPASWLRQWSDSPLPQPGVDGAAEGEISLEWKARLMPASSGSQSDFNPPTTFISGYGAPFVVEANHKPWSVETPDAWTWLFSKQVSYKMKFEWSDCCGLKKRRFSPEPVLPAGIQRKDRGPEGGPGTEFYREPYSSGF